MPDAAYAAERDPTTTSSEVVAVIERYVDDAHRRVLRSTTDPERGLPRFKKKAEQAMDERVLRVLLELLREVHPEVLDVERCKLPATSASTGLHWRSRKRGSDAGCRESPRSRRRACRSERSNRLRRRRGLTLSCLRFAAGRPRAIFILRVGWRAVADGRDLEVIDVVAVHGRRPAGFEKRSPVGRQRFPAGSKGLAAPFEIPAFRGATSSLLTGG